MICLFFFNKKLVNSNFKKVLDLSKNLGIHVNLPCSFKKYNSLLQPCCSPWDYFYVENQGNVNKCIFADTHIGNLNKSSFDKIWNNKKYVNKLSSHITFRPQTYNKMLKYIIDNKEKYKLKLEEIM